MKAEQITDPVAYHGEGPVWSSSWGGLRWVDMFAGDVLSLRPDGSVGRRHIRVAGGTTGHRHTVAALRPRSRGGAVIAVERGFILEDADGTTTALDEVWSDGSVRMNEGGCGPDGAFYCGSMSYTKERGAGALYRLAPDRTVQVVVHDVTVSNGIDWSPDGSLAYYNDTDTHRVDVFDYSPDTGLTGRRPYVSTPGSRPDGLTVDSEGGVWVAFNGDGAVHRYTPGGVLDQVIDVGARKVTACTFGGPALDRLYITTSRENLETGADPLAGSLFRADVGIVGQPVRMFDG